MNHKKSLVINAVLNAAKTVLGIVFPLITYPYVARILGVKSLGIYAFSFSFLSFFLLIAALGISTYGIREGVQYRDNRKQIEEFVSELFSINIISTIIAYLLLLVFLFGIPYMAPYRKVVLILSLEIMLTTFGVSWVCNIYEDFLAIATRTIVFQIISLLLIFLFVKTSTDLYKYVVILLISNSGANIINFFYIRNKYCKFYFTTKIDWKTHFKPILVIFSTTVAITIYVSSDTTMLGFLTNDYQVGLYGSAVKIYTIIKNVLAAILMVLIPRFSLTFSTDNKQESNELFSKVFNILTVIMLPMCVGLFSISDDIVLLLFGDDYIGSALPLKLLSVAVVFSLYAYMYTQCILIPIKEERIVFRATTISAIINIGLNFVMIPLWGICAAAITTIIAEAVTFMVAYYYSKGVVKVNRIKRTLISTFIGCVGIIICCYYFERIKNLMPRVFVSVVCSACEYFIILIIMKNPVIFDLIEVLKIRMRKIKN